MGFMGCEKQESFGALSALEAVDSLDKLPIDFIYSPGVSWFLGGCAHQIWWALFFEVAVTYPLSRRSSVGRAVDS